MSQSLLGCGHCCRSKKHKVTLLSSEGRPWGAEVQQSPDEGFIGTGLDPGKEHHEYQRIED